MKSVYKTLDISLICYLYLFISSNCLGQTNQGYLVLNNLDTVHGIFLTELNYELTNEVTLKLEDQKEVTYRPESIRSFYMFNEKFFESRKTKDNESEKNFQIILKGKISLLVLHEKDKDRIFLCPESNELYELVETFEETTNGKRSKYEYILTLKKVLGEAITLNQSQRGLELNRNIEKTKLKIPDLVNLLILYHNIIEQPDPKIFRHKTTTITNLVIYNGISYSLTSSSLGYRGGILLTFSQPEIRNNFTLKTGILYMSNPYLNNRGIVDLYIPLLASLRLDKDKKSPYLYGGISLSFSSGLRYTSFNTKETERYYAFNYPVLNFGIGKELNFRKKHPIHLDFSYMNSTVSLNLGYQL